MGRLGRGEGHRPIRTRGLTRRPGDFPGNHSPGRREGPMATTRGKCRRRSTISAMNPVSGSLTPVPKRASTRMSVRAGSRRDRSLWTNRPPRRSTQWGLPSFGLLPDWSWRPLSRTPAEPSEPRGWPRLPGGGVGPPPGRLRRCSPCRRPPAPSSLSSPKCRSISRTTPLPAFSMSSRLGRPYREVVSRSTQLICPLDRILILPLVAGFAHIARTQSKRLRKFKSRSKPAVPEGCIPGEGTQPMLCRERRRRMRNAADRRQRTG